MNGHQVDDQPQYSEGMKGVTGYRKEMKISSAAGELEWWV